MFVFLCLLKYLCVCFRLLLNNVTKCCLNLFQVFKFFFLNKEKNKINKFIYVCNANTIKEVKTVSEVDKNNNNNRKESRKPNHVLGRLKREEEWKREQYSKRASNNEILNRLNKSWSLAYICMYVHLYMCMTSII